MANNTYQIIIGIGVAVLVFSLLAGTMNLATPVFAGAGSSAATGIGVSGICNESNGYIAETVTGQGTGMNCAVTNSTAAHAATNESGAVIYPLLPYIGIAGGLILIVFGKPISGLIGRRF